MRSRHSFSVICSFILFLFPITTYSTGESSYSNTKYPSFFPPSGVCNVKSFTTDIYAGAAVVTARTGTTGSGGSLSGQANVPDANSANWADLQASFFIIGSSSSFVSVRTGGVVYPAGSVVGAVANVSGGGTIEIRTYLAGSSRQTVSSFSSTTYYSGATNRSFTATQSFDEIQFYISSAGLLAGSITADLFWMFAKHPDLATSSVNTNPSTFGGSNGAINLSVTGGLAPFTYSWSNGASTEDLTGLTAGTYSVTVTDANTCTQTLSATLIDPSGPGGVPSPAIWLKANTGVTTGATFTWADQSGNNRNGVQSTATNQPTLNSNLINFNPALVLDGTNDYLNLQNLTGLPTGAAQVEGFSVARNLNTGGGWNHVIAYGGTAGNSFFTLGKQTGTANAVTGFNGSDALSSALEYTGGAPVLSNGKYTGTQGVISTFGRQRGTVNFTGAKAITNGKIGVDPTTALTTCWNGNIAEAILFSGNLTTTQVSQINTYLAIKYGITLDQTTAQNYLASDGSTILWNGTTNSTYKNNIAGIARDDASVLNQKQSKSVNTGLQVVMGNGNTISADNVSNTNNFSADKSALIWGDNAASVAAWTTTGAPSARQIVARAWKVQETGTVTSVKVQIADNSGSNGLPAETTTVYLLVDGDGNFSAGATEYPMTLNGTNWEANVDFTSGQFFTFATQVPPAPGGVVSNMVLWLKPDAGTLNGGSAATNGQTVTTWQDQSGNANHFTTASTEGIITGAPTWISNSVNFNPGIGFNGTQGLHRTSNLYTNNSNFEIINVHTNSGVGGMVFANNSGDNQNPIFGRYGYAQFINASSTIFDIANGGSNDARVYHLSRTNTGGSNYSITNYFNGKSVGTGTSTANFTANNSKTTIGYRSYSNDGGRQPAIDPIHEVIVYNANITATQRQQINSYLAIKYGFTLDQTVATSYLNSSGTTIWDASGNAAFTNNIGGIARDDASVLNQKQSKSVNSGLQVVMGNGNTIAATNASNSSTFSADNSALVWGDNAASVAAWTTTGAPPSRQKIARTWKVQETGTVGYVKVQVPDNSGTNGLPAETNTVYLLVDADGNFASGATEYQMTLNGTNWEVPVDLTTGQFFTFATQENSPLSLNLTMTGDKTTVTSGQNITYTLTITNSGTNSGTNIKVKDQLPGGVNFVSATPSAGTYDAATGIWTIPALAPGSQTLSILVTVQ